MRVGKLLGSNNVVQHTHDAPVRSRCEVSLTSAHRGVTQPIPVTTTRRRMDEILVMAGRTSILLRRYPSLQGAAEASHRPRGPPERPPRSANMLVNHSVQIAYGLYPPVARW